MPAKKIKLFVDAHSFDRGFQGTQTFIREMYTQLLANYPELDVYWGVENADKIKELFPSVKPENILLYKKRRLSLLRLLFDVPAYIKKHRFDFAHFQYISPLPQAGCKYIVTTHDVLFNDFPADFSFAYRVSRNILFGRSIKNAAINTTVSAYSAKRISHHFNVPEDQIKVVPNAVTKTELSKETAKLIIRAKYGLADFVLYVSRVEPRKNHTLLLQKYLKLELYKKNIPLVFIGEETTAVKKLQKTIEKLTPAQRSMFYWFPQVGQNDLSAFYAACRLFVYPSRAEGFGIPPLEAAMAQVPVLCSSATAMGEFECFKPYTFNPDDEADFEIKLASMIIQPPSERFLKNTAASAAIKYQWEHSAALFFDALTEALNQEKIADTNASRSQLAYNNPQLQFK